VFFLSFFHSLLGPPAACGMERLCSCRGPVINRCVGGSCVVSEGLPETGEIVDEGSDISLTSKGSLIPFQVRDCGHLCRRSKDVRCGPSHLGEEANSTVLSVILVSYTSEIRPLLNASSYSSPLITSESASVTCTVGFFLAAFAFLASVMYRSELRIISLGSSSD
jgi:hypothetical protein